MKTRNLIACTLLAFALFAGPTTGQDNDSGGKYVNPELGVAFTGVYGWDAKFSAGSGAWTDLASYKHEGHDARVVLQVRNNIYPTLEALRKALKREFAGAAEPAPDKPAYKELEFRDAEMKRGNKMKGIEVAGVVTTVTTEGKKREHFMLVRTYFGKNRLFRVHCTVRRSRAKKVRDLFDIALAGLVVKGAAEKVAGGTSFDSARGRYRCEIPAGFRVAIPARGSTDVRFKSKEVTIAMVSYRSEGELVDHRDSLKDYYEDKIKLEADDVKVFGAGPVSAVS